METSAGTPSVAVEGGLAGRTDSANQPKNSSSEQVRIQGTRAQQRVDTKERIFETALREFRDVGFAATSIDGNSSKVSVRTSDGTNVNCVYFRSGKLMLLYVDGRTFTPPL